jgi:hypothetical protein
MHDTAKADGAALPVADIAIKHLERVYSETAKRERTKILRASGKGKQWTAIRSFRPAGKSGDFP